MSFQGYQYCFSPSLQYFVTVSLDLRVRIHDIETQEIIFQQTPTKHLDTQCQCIKWFNDKLIGILTTTKQFLYINLDNLDSIECADLTVEGSPIDFDHVSESVIAILLDNRQTITYDYLGTQVIDMVSFSKSYSKPHKHIVWNHDQEFDFDYLTVSSKIYQWKTSKRTPVHSISTKCGEILDMFTSPYGICLLTENTVEFVRVGDSDVFATMSVENEPNNVTFCEMEGYYWACVSCVDGEVSVFKFDSSKRAKRVDPQYTLFSEEKLLSVAFTHSDTILCCCGTPVAPTFIHHGFGDDNRQEIIVAAIEQKEESIPTKAKTVVSSDVATSILPDDELEINTTKLDLPEIEQQDFATRLRLLGLLKKEKKIEENTLSFDSVAELLNQGVRNHDKHVIDRALNITGRSGMKVIRSSVEMLDEEILFGFLEILYQIMQEKPGRLRLLAPWISSIMTLRSVDIMRERTKFIPLLLKIKQAMNARVQSHGSLAKLLGRMELLKPVVLKQTHDESLRLLLVDSSKAATEILTDSNVTIFTEIEAEEKMESSDEEEDLDEDFDMFED
eukprot:TRINITY_DN3117_c0_g2_i1.p1 TRINITY_DN3117_c0_g2~~TRINITY_DN3117_c0_g2_i1.p1  ORF type:complete len:569 (+),score=173.87 TRINITY_DN3117_c0_g2_i1:29-1708(+)